MIVIEAIGAWIATSFAIGAGWVALCTLADRRHPTERTHQ